MKQTILSLLLLVIINNLCAQENDTIKKFYAQKKDTLKNSYVQNDSIKNSLDIESILSKGSSMARRGGSDVGGGNLYSSIINWCNTSSIIIQESKEEALELWGYSNDKIGAIKVFYLGLIKALKSNPNPNINFNNSITYRAISRGIGLSQVLGVPAIIDGQAQEQDINQIMSFFNFYYDFITRISQKLDKDFYLPFHARAVCRDCSEIPNINTLDLERELIRYTISQISQWRAHFVRSNSQGYYPTIDIVRALNGLAYLATESANDLELSLFNKVYACQAKKLKRLALSIHHFVLGRMNTSLDAIKLNKYVIKVDQVIQNINRRDCF